jgi:hypothetical protein
MKKLSIIAFLLLAAGQVRAQTPVITSISPNTASTCSTGLTLTVNGSGFSSDTYPAYAATVYFGTTALTTTFISTSQLTATVTAASLTPARTVSVTVRQLGGITSNAVNFTVTAGVQASISSISPSSAAVGSGNTTITITGSGFEPSSTAYWGINRSVLSTTYVNSTTLTAIIASTRLVTAGTFDIVVRNTCGYSNAVPFTVIGFSITSVSPNSAVACGSGITITVTGIGFQFEGAPPSTVYWNSSALATSYLSSTQLRATVPASLLASAGTASITVRQSGMTSNSLPFTITAAVVTISSVTPNSATAGSTNVTITVNGSGFTQSSAVRWAGTTNLATTFLSSTQLSASIPSNLLTTVGQFSITVTTPCGTSNAIQFSVTGPLITSVQPGSAPWCGSDLSITVTGSGFQAGAVVRWNSTSLSTSFANATSLTAIVPASLLRTAGTASLTVQNPGAITSNSYGFVVSGSSPAITSLSPNSAYTGAVTFTLTVNGSGFSAASTVRWGSTALPTSYISPTQLTATVNSSLLDSAGPVSITVGHDCGQSGAATFTILAAPLTILSLTPSSAAGCGSDVTIRVSGAGFRAGAAVRWNGVALSTSFVSDTQLTAVVESNQLVVLGTASVSVRNPDGATSGSLPFTIGANPHAISTLSPINIVAGSPSFTLTVFGSSFGPSMSVHWSGTDLRTEFRSTSELGAVVPADLIKRAGKYLISVASLCGESRTLEFEVLPPATATVTSVDPTSAPSCSSELQLTVTGTGFVSGAEVRWNGTALPTTFVSATQLTARVDANLLSSAGVARISVQAPGPVTTNSVDFTVTAVTPVITSLTPASAVPGAPAFTLTVTGTGFMKGMTVRWGETNLTTTYVSPQELTAAVPAIPTSSPSSIDVRVANACGAISAPVSFKVIAGLAITSLSPNAITAGSADLTLTVNGTGFVANSVVRWNTTSLTTTFRSTAQLTAVVPSALLANAATAQITVTTPAGLTSTALPFTVTALPVITSLTPSSVDAGSAAFTLTVNGSGYVAGASILWGSTQLTTTFASATRLTAPVTATMIATPGAVSVTVSLPGGTASNAVSFTVNLPPLPTMTLTGLPPSCTTAQQHQPQISLATPYPLPMSGELTLTFQPLAAIPAASDFMQNYRQVQFASGGSRTPFTLPAAGARIDLPMIQTGTVAGTITAAVSQLTCASTPVTPPSTTVQTIQVIESAPKITTLGIVRTSTGFEVRIVGDSSIREVTEMSITFQAGAGATLQTTSLTVPLSTVFAAYYADAASSAYGSTYLLTVPFTIDGQQTAVTSAAVTLRNRIGASSSVSATF